MRPLFTAFLIALSCTSLLGEPYVIDFSENHRIDQVKNSGAEYTTFSSRIDFVRLHTQPVLLVFPGGREISFQVRRGSFTYNPESGVISVASLYTELMPADEAAEVMRIFKRSIGQSTEDVERWLAEVAENKHHQPLKFDQLGTSTGWVNYPALIFRTKSSMNPTYEWELALTIRWTPSRYPEGWDEAKAAEHNPRPPVGYERISLDPPSGRFYSREEGLQLAFGEIEDSGPTPEAGSGTEPKAPPPPDSIPGPVQPVQPEPEPEPPSRQLWPFGLVLVLMVVLGVWLRRKRRKG